MVESTSPRRSQIKQELLTKAKNYLNNFDSYSLAYEDPSRNYVARQAFENGLAVTIIKYRCDGLTEEHWQRWIEDPIGIQEAMNNRLTSTQLADDDGHKVFHLHMKMPMMITNRSLITCMYEHEDAVTGFRSYLHSSQGCEAIIQSER